MNKLSTFEENLVWMSYRYAIGRHTATSVDHAYDLAEYLSDKLDDNRAKFMADDIRREMSTILKFKYAYDGDKENCLHECIEQSNNDSFSFVDLIAWDELARFLDKDSHVMVKTKLCEIECVETYRYDYSKKQYIKEYKSIQDIATHRTNTYIDQSQIISIQ